MKLDTIDVELVRGKDDRGTPYEAIELILNGEKLKNRTFDPFEFAVPRIKNANWYTVEDLSRSVQRYNDFIKKHRSSWSW